ncbi:hypothetical protein ACFSHR_15300 [Azotobacter chroococcum]
MVAWNRKDPAGEDRRFPAIRPLSVDALVEYASTPIIMLPSVIVAITTLPWLIAQTAGEPSGLLSVLRTEK